MLRNLTVTICVFLGKKCRKRQRLTIPLFPPFHHSPQRKMSSSSACHRRRQRTIRKGSVKSVLSLKNDKSLKRDFEDVEDFYFFNHFTTGYCGRRMTIIVLRKVVMWIWIKNVLFPSWLVVVHQNARHLRWKCTTASNAWGKRSGKPY